MKLLSKLLLVVALMTTPAYAANLFVPDQHPTIQAAVDAASPGDRILVAAGDYDGAFITKRVKISGEGDETVITHGPNVQVGRWWFQNGFEIAAGADGTSIRDLKIDLDPDRVIFPPHTPPWVELVQDGIFGNSVNKVEVHNVIFAGLNEGVSIWNSKKWNVTNNTVIGMQSTQARRAAGIRLVNTANSFVGFNEITHDGTLEDNFGKRFSGIELNCFNCLEPAENNKLVQNEVAITAPGAVFVDGIRLFDGSAFFGGPVMLFDNKIIQNSVDSIVFLPVFLAEHNVIE